MNTPIKQPTEIQQTDMQQNDMQQKNKQRTLRQAQSSPENPSRREIMRLASALSLAFATGILKPSEVFAASEWGIDWNGAVYSAKSLEAFVIAMSGDTTTPNSSRTVTELGSAPGLSRASDSEITMDAPELAENGTNVPVTISSKLPGTDFIALIADHNPTPVCVGFNVLPDNDPAYTVRIKVAETSTLIAAVRAQGRWYFVSRDITVMIGGCLG